MADLDDRQKAYRQRQIQYVEKLQADIITLQSAVNKLEQENLALESAIERIGVENQLRWAILRWNSTSSPKQSP